MGVVSYLLDTGTFLWAVRGSSNLSNNALEVLNDANIVKYISSVSAFEIMNRFRIGKLSGFEDVASVYLNFAKTLRAVKLPITEEHVYYAGKFEWEHRAPFDRLLAAQAYIEKLTIITSDSAFHTLSWVFVLL